MVPAELSYLLFHWRSSSESNGTTATTQTTTTTTATPPPPEEIPESGKRDDEKEDFKDVEEEVDEDAVFTSNPVVAYSIHVIHTPGAAMRRPALNVSAVGVVPEEEEAFAVHFPCTGLASGAVDFLLQVLFLFMQYHKIPS